MDPTQIPGAAFKWVGSAFRRFFWKSRMQDQHRLEKLSEMLVKLRAINKVQSRPDNHACIKFCHDYRDLIDDEGAVGQIESAYELITRNQMATFEKTEIIKNLIQKIGEEVYRIQTK